MSSNNLTIYKYTFFTQKYKRITVDTFFDNMEPYIGRTWENEPPEIIDKRINRLQKDIEELESDKKAYHIANDGEKIGKSVTSPDYNISWMLVKYNKKYYTLTCSQSKKNDALVAWCDVHEGEHLYGEFKERYGLSKW